uniref:ATP-dependent DNA helicase DDM1-like n=1 Tax=Cicer arietinum TaxID=3827 RepID=A0A3Q7Y4Q2_CICAR|nr:ATP-dependent DNA helicase DDM1-like [Cicer arietinum]
MVSLRELMEIRNVKKMPGSSWIRKCLKGVRWPGNLDRDPKGWNMPPKQNQLKIAIRSRTSFSKFVKLKSAFDRSYFYPPVNEIIEQCGKFHLLNRLLERLFARNHKVLIFSQWTRVLDIMDYYFSEKGFEVCRIDGSVKLEDRKRQVCTNAWITPL